MSLLSVKNPVSQAKHMMDDITTLDKITVALLAQENVSSQGIRICE